MDTLKTRNKVRNKPRHKISYQAGYNVWGKDRFENLTRQKWNRAKKEFPLRPPSGARARTSLDNLFSERLRARQVLRQIYGKLTKRQFKTIFNKSEFGHSKSKKSITGLLDRRLDSFVLRLGFSTTIFKARQDVLHGSFKVNGYFLSFSDRMTPPWVSITAIITSVSTVMREALACNVSF